MFTLLSFRHFEVFYLTLNDPKLHAILSLLRNNDILVGKPSFSKSTLSLFGSVTLSTRCVNGYFFLSDAIGVNPISSTGIHQEEQTVSPSTRHFRSLVCQPGFFALHSADFLVQVVDHSPHSPHVPQLQAFSGTGNDACSIKSSSFTFGPKSTN